MNLWCGIIYHFLQNERIGVILYIILLGLDNGPNLWTHVILLILVE